jgi:hypothetical protein
MELKIKKQFLEYSIGGGKLKLVKLKDLPENKWKQYYDMGFKEFFSIVKTKVVEPEIIEKNNNIEDDFNK